MDRTREVTSTGLVDNVKAQLYRVEDIKAALPNWDDLSQEAKIRALEDLDPEATVSTHNATTRPYREHLASLINPEIAEDPVDVEHIAFGEDDTAPDPDDSHLNSEIHRVEIDDHIDRGEEYSATILFGGDDAVGLDLVEAALVTEADESAGDDMAVNRVILDDPENRLQPKTSDYAVAVTMELGYSDAAE